jgi:hypothetical protein
MRGSLFKGVVLGSVCSALVFVASSALAGSGVGGVFNLGQTNSVDAKTTLTGASSGIQMQVTNTNAAGRNGLAVNSASGYPTGSFTNTGGGSAGGFFVNAGVAPFSVNSNTKVANLNADRLDGLDSTAFLTAGTKATDADKLDGLDSNSFTQGFASRVSYVKRTLPNAPGTELTLLDLGWVRLVAKCDTSYLVVGAANPGADPVEVGRINPQGYYVLSNTVDRVVSLFDANPGGGGILQASQSYRPGGVGFPRTRMATFTVSGAADRGDGCHVHAQALAQGF